MRKTVAVGMSGGVDSSVTAALLKEEGYKVIGFTMLLIDDFDYSDAEKVCMDLNIEFYLLDLRKQFKQLVKDRFLSDYKNGRTPNPCVLCNKYIKFGILYEELLKLNVDYVATGHYAMIKNGHLYKGLDEKKDQSYFLFNLTKEQLEKVIFPLSNYSKEEVRKLALKYNLTVADKKESNDICFIKNGEFKTFIKQNLGTSPGDIIDVATNEKIGTHNGLMYYTIGQRRGLNLGGNTDRFFVAKKDLVNNVLYVAMGNQNEFLMSTSCILSEVNLINSLPEKCLAKFRYHQEDNEVMIEKLSNGDIKVNYPQGIKAVTLGQACVFYKENECLGGGIVKEVF